jgi:UDP-glucose-4-epimerase GalE
MKVMVTGGAGYIGSHACQRLLKDGHTVLCVDNLFRGHRTAMDLLAKTAGDRLLFVEADAGDRWMLQRLLGEHAIDTILHFAARAYVGESVEDPLGYYRANVAAMTGLLEACDAPGVRLARFVFSSSCATYGDPPEGMIPVPEHCPQHPTSPYGRTKLINEWMLRDWAHARAQAGRPVAVSMLRYFNVAGSDRSGLLGEDHTPETHLIPVAIQAAMGKRDKMTIFGTDYPTPDGTNIRDYVHVEDLIEAHVRAMETVKPGREPAAFNVGIGRGYSVRQVLESVQRVSGKTFRIDEGPRRAGDAVALYNDPSKITRELGWTAKVDDLDEIVASAWAWMKRHPEGYGEK